MTITHDQDEDKFAEHKLFDCNVQNYGNCTCREKCKNGNNEILMNPNKE